MNQPYEMKDLGYPRKPAVGVLVVGFDNGEKYHVPLQVICDSRDEHYADEQEDTFDFVTTGGLSEYDIEDWASNNMDWSELSPYAKKVDVPQRAYDYEEGWASCSKDAEIPKEKFKSIL